MSFSYIFNFKPMLYYQKNNKFCNIFVEKSTLTIRDNLIRLKFFFTIFDVFLLVSCVLDQSGAKLVRETEQSKQDKPMNRSWAPLVQLLALWLAEKFEKPTKNLSKRLH